MNQVNLRVGVVCINDGYYSVQLLEQLLKHCGNRIVFIAEIKTSGIEKKNFDVRIRELLVIALLYGFSGISAVLKSQLSGMRCFRELASSREYVKANSPTDKEFILALKKADLDVIIHQTPHRLPKNFLSIPKLGVWNRHCAQVPQYCGMYTPFWAWYTKEKTAGVSILEVGVGYDDGAILSAKKVDILGLRFPCEILRLLMKESTQLLVDTILAQERLGIEKKQQQGERRYFSVPGWNVLLKAIYRMGLQIVS